ncbi:MAG: hypothetical protein ACJAXB_001395 [Candidatus Endobugula sp.]|jgi:uncharacterized protein (DUF1501 family)
MERRDFISLTSTLTGGALLLPNFLHTLGFQKSMSLADPCLVFIQLNGGNDGLNAFLPYQDPLYYALRPNIALSKKDVISANQGMAFHPKLKGLAEIQQMGHLSVIQNVGYPEPNRSHFRSTEIWQTASAASEYINEGWLGRYLDLQCKEHQPTASLNIDSTDNLSLKGIESNTLTVKDPNRFKINRTSDAEVKLSDNPQLDFVRRIANALPEGSEEIQKALKRTSSEQTYPNSALAKNLEWIARLIKGDLNSMVYYTSLGGFDTHDNQLPIQERLFTQLNDAIYSFYIDLKSAGLLDKVTLVVFSEFGRRVKDNGNGTDHGTAAPVFIIGGGNKGKIIGDNPDLGDLEGGDLKYKIDFRSVYASLLKQRMNFDPERIGIKNSPLMGLF